MEMKKGRRGIGFCRSSCVVLVLLCLLQSLRFRERARFSFEKIITEQRDSRGRIQLKTYCPIRRPLVVSLVLMNPPQIMFSCFAYC